MHHDNYYSIGSDHAVCQDYALSGVSEQFNSGYAIVCDGCSASKDVDFGARMLALSARETLRLAPIDYSTYGLLTIRKADTAFAILPLISPQFLDATLLVASIRDGILTAYIYGDGMLLHKSADSLRCVHVKFEIPMDGEDKGAPAYLSYHLDSQRKRQYEDLGGVKQVYDGITNLKSGDRSALSGTTNAVKPFAPVVIQSPVSSGDIILLTSDGIDSFRRPDNSPIEWHEVVNEFIDFKNMTGVFVRRRMEAFERRCKRDQIRHLDDVSVAAIHV